MSDERVHLSYEQAVAMLPDGEEVHTFRNPGGMLLGADWPREDVLKAIEAHGAELSGELATRMGHGLWVQDGTGRGLFIATKKPEAAP